MNLTSNKLKETQLTLEQLVKIEIDKPNTNYAKVNRLTKVIQEIDILRQETWNNETFGEYEEIVDNALSFCSDDIPF